MTSSELQREVREKYNSRPEIWLARDIWHRHNYESLSSIVQRVLDASAGNQSYILNLGSGGTTYGVRSPHHFQLDLADRRLPRNGCSVVGNAETLPFAAESADIVLCVGEVLNYCDALAALGEFARVLKPGARLLVEFESSRSFEYVATSSFGKTQVFVNTTFQLQPERFWLYNPSYIASALEAFGLTVVSTFSFHSVTALVFRLFKSERIAMQLAWLDRSTLAHWLLGRFACNCVFLAEKPKESDETCVE